jgi:transposase-like protein
MPWPEHRIVDLRKEFVLAAVAPKANISALCKAHGISRTNGYKWLKRYKEHGIHGLVPWKRN